MPWIALKARNLGPKGQKRPNSHFSAIFSKSVQTILFNPLSPGYAWGRYDATSRDTPAGVFIAGFEFRAVFVINLTAGCS